MSDYQGNIIIKNPATPAGPFENGAAPGVWKLSEVLPFVRQGIWPTQGVQAADPFFPYVSLLLSTTALGNANNNLFVDSSGAFNPISRNGNTTQGSFTPYGASWSNYFDGTGDYLTVPDDNALDFGTGDFTIEMWINAQNLSSIPMLFHKGTSVSTGWFFQTSGSTLYFGQLDSARYSTWSVSLANNAWYHIALTRVGAVLNVFVNGVSQGAQTVTNANLSNDNTGLLYIGEYINGTYYYQGYLSNYRVVKGTAVYTSNFSPSGTPLTAISGTSLLTCQSNRFRDASTNNFTISVFGNTSVTEFSPFAPARPGISYNQSDITNWSGYFDGTGDYLTAPDNAALQLGSSDFTIEFWVNFTTVPGSLQGATLVSKFNTSNTGYEVILYNNTMYFQAQTANIAMTYAFTPTAGLWYHIAWTRSGANSYGFINGALVASTSAASGSITNLAQALQIGRRGDNTFYLTGYMSNVRVVKGTAVYTSAFTPPTTNLTAISGTSLLTLQNAAFTDNSTNNFVITPFGNTTVTGNSPFNTVGYWSNYFDGATSYLSVPVTSSAFTLNGDFTIEAWVYRAPSGIMTMFDTRTGGNYTDWVVGLNASGQFDFVTVGGAGVRITTTETVTPNVWTHVACVRQGSTVKVYFNGVASVNTATYGTTITPASSVGYIGGSKDPVYSTGYMSNLRLVKGTAVYTANFTPPTAPLTAISGTSLLTCQNGRFIDNSTNAFTITPVGTPSVQSFNPFYTSTIASNGGSMYFDGTGDYFTVPYAANMRYSGDFTIECWVNPTARLRLYPCIVGNYSTFTSNGGFAIFAGHNSSSATKYQVAFNGSFPFIQSTSDIIYGAWAHIALVRVGSTITLYINGVANGTGTSSATVVGTANNWWVGTAGDSLTDGAFNGYINGLRATPFAVYTAAFTPPTTPLTPSANTTLLVNGMNAGAYDATAINNMETVGNAQVSTAVSKFGGSSVYFDGSGDYLTTPTSPQFGFGTGDFTIEGWIYPTGVSGTDSVIFDLRSGSSANNSPVMIIASGTNNLVYIAAGAARITGSAVTLNTWSHFAVSRSGTSTKLFLNGTQVGSTYTDTNNYLNPARLWVGADDDGSPNAYYIGYIDDLRVTKGVARYTANFTPPTQAFPPY